MGVQNRGRGVIRGQRGRKMRPRSTAKVPTCPRNERQVVHRACRWRPRAWRCRHAWARARPCYSTNTFWPMALSHLALRLARATPSVSGHPGLQRDNPGAALSRGQVRWADGRWERRCCCCSGCSGESAIGGAFMANSSVHRVSVVLAVLVSKIRSYGCARTPDRTSSDQSGWAVGGPVIRAMHILLAWKTNTVWA